MYVVELNEQQQQESIAQHLHAVIGRSYQVAQQEIDLQCSVGYCVFPLDAEDADILLQKANLALFQAETNNIQSVKLLCKHADQQKKFQNAIS